jgi:hypothetical protein
MEAIKTIDDADMPERSLGWEMLAWASDYLVQPDGPNAGEPIVFTAEQARFLLRFYAVDPASGRFTVRRAALRRMKGWGKDPLGAAVALFELLGPCRFDGFGAEGQPIGAPHPAPLVQIAAVSLFQTKTTMSLLPSMLAPAAYDEYGTEAGYEIIRAAGGGRIEAVTSSPRALEGARPSLVVLNETEHWLTSNQGHEMHRVVMRNLAKSRDGASRSIELANAHLVGEESVAEVTFNAFEKGGRKVKGMMYDSLEAPVVDLDDAEAVRQAVEVARGDSHWVDVERIAAEIMDPSTRATEARRFYLNQLVGIGDEAGWLPAGAWDACAAPRRAIEGGSEVVLGFDGSTNRDSTALVVVKCGERPHADVVGVWERPEGPAGADWRVPVTEVLDEIREACRRWEVREIAADTSRWVAELEGLADEGLPVVEYPQSRTRMIPATERATAAIIEKKMSHSGDSRLDRHVRNAIRRPDGQLSKVSKHSGRKIDLAVSLVMPSTGPRSPRRSRTATRTSTSPTTPRSNASASRSSSGPTAAPCKPGSAPYRRQCSRSTINRRRIRRTVGA